MCAKTLFESACHNQTAISTTTAFFTTILPHASDNHPACFKNTPDFISIQHHHSSSPFQPSSIVKIAISQQRHFNSTTTPTSYISPLQTAFPHLETTSRLAHRRLFLLVPKPGTATNEAFTPRRKCALTVPSHLYQQEPSCNPASHPRPSQMFK